MNNTARTFDPGDLLAERFNGGHVKGVLVRAHIDWVRDHCDRRDVIAFFDAIPNSVRGVLAASWYPFADLIAVDRILMQRFGGNEPRFLRQVGAYSASQNLLGVHRFFHRAGVHDFFHRSALLHLQFQDFGGAQYRETSATEGMMVHSRYTSFSPLFCESAAGFYGECIRLHGGTNVDVRETCCQCRGDATCTFEMTWR